MLLALLIAMGGLVSLSVIMLGRSGYSLEKGKSNIGQLADLEKAIRAHVFLTRRLPCPANGDEDGVSKPSCTGTDNDGVVPWTTLGLSKDDAKDPYGRLISYHVDPDLAASADKNFCINSGSGPGNMARDGTIRLNPSTGTSLFVLISHGPNGLGGWLPTGRQSVIPSSTLERENCPDSAASAGNVTCANPDAKDVTQGPYQGNPAAANYFDDAILAAESNDYTAVCQAI